MGGSKEKDMADIYAEAGLSPPIPTERIMEAMGNPCSEWMMPEAAVDWFELEPVEWTAIKAIYELPLEKRFFRMIQGKRNLFVTHLLMPTKEQHDKNEYVKLDKFFMRRLAEEKKKKPLSSG
ncbi:Hypothetical predicted protein [Olea europaea subsp. europaea]|uniref:Uncharacterized protein n=1 Tax=Olea europaea subsp. europaea TaxID=158383 RepID=A0A8S0QT90_OLEEU|nr:Hypothetical predicted protein [Olea europaea subsp. europaea]